MLTDKIMLVSHERRIIIWNAKPMGFEAITAQSLASARRGSGCKHKSPDE